MASTLVSVVVPVHNGERFLEQALESVLAQDYAPLEVIVVDDGSTDGSAAIARAYDIGYVRQPNLGVAAARNAGVEAGTGELIAFLDQDDLWLPAKVSRQADQLARNPELGFVATLMDLFVEPGTPRPAWLEPGREAKPEASWLLSTVMIRREVFARVGPFDPAYRYASDADWILRARRLGIRCAPLAESLVRYRVHGENQSHERSGNVHELFRVLRAAAVERRRTTSTGETRGP